MIGLDGMNGLQEALMRRIILRLSTTRNTEMSLVFPPIGFKLEEMDSFKTLNATAAVK